MKLSGKFLVRTLLAASAAAIIGVGTAVGAFLVFDARHPPPLAAAPEVSTEVVDADGKLLRAFATNEGRWRLQTRLNDIDPEYLKLLVAYEDQRFWTHAGVDGLALLRAAGQLAVNGRIVSGGSTITMQLARLLEPRPNRSMTSKLLQIVRAIQIERRLSKKEILERYLMHAPYGGNIEGVRAASLAYFKKDPKALSLAEAALLVALPQSPERRRPDRHAAAAKKARDRVLARASAAGAIAPGEVARASRTGVSKKRHALPQHAAHLARRIISAEPGKTLYQVTLRRGPQRALEQVAREAARELGARVSVAMVLADAETGAIRAEVGSPNFLEERRAGWIDMTRAVRSPGSALKPFIYGLAFEEGLVRPETLIMDAPADFAGYRPRNFDMRFHGEISVRRALQLSLNVPALHLLEAVGPQRLLVRLRQAGIETSTPPADQPGLAIGLGGIGITLRELTQAYTALANGGRVSILRNRPAVVVNPATNATLLQPVAAWHVNDILSGTLRPASASAQPIAYKTGTSYGYRDAWSVGYDGRHVLGVWVGRADNAPVPGLTGLTAAAPILFEAFDKLALKWSPLPPAPPGALRTAQGDLPVTLRRFKVASRTGASDQIPEPPPQIVYPPHGAEVELAGTATGDRLPLIVKLQGGQPPFRWLANGQLISERSHARTAAWLSDGAGFSTITAIDAAGRAARVKVYIHRIP